MSISTSVIQSLRYMYLPIKQVLARDVVSSILYKENEQWAYCLSDTITEVFSRKLAS